MDEIDLTKIQEYNDLQAQAAEERAKIEDTALALNEILKSQKGIENSVRESILALAKFIRSHKPEVSVINQKDYPSYDEVVKAVKNVVGEIKNSNKSLASVEQKKADYTPIIKSLDKVANLVAKLPTTVPKTLEVTNQKDYTGKFDEVTKALGKIPAPIVNVEKPVIPDNSKELDKIIKAVEKIKFPEIPKTDLKPLIEATQKVSKTISNLSFPVPNYVLPFKNTQGVATQVQLDSSGNLPINFGGTVNSAPTFKRDPADAGESARFGLVDTAGNVQTGSRFSRVAKAEASVGEELRFDDISAGDLYIGAAVAGTAITATGWDIVKYTRTTTGSMTRCQFLSNQIWNNRLTLGW